MESNEIKAKLAEIPSEQKIHWPGREKEYALAKLADGAILIAETHPKKTSYMDRQYYFKDVQDFLERTHEWQRTAEKHNSGDRITFCDKVVDMIPGDQVEIETLVSKEVRYPREMKISIWVEKDIFYTCSQKTFRYKKVSPGLWLAGEAGGEYRFHSRAELLGRLESRLSHHEYVLKQLQPQLTHLTGILSQAVIPLVVFHRSVSYLASEC